MNRKQKPNFTIMDNNNSPTSVRDIVSYFSKPQNSENKKSNSITINKDETSDIPLKMHVSPVISRYYEDYNNNNHLGGQSCLLSSRNSNQLQSKRYGESTKNPRLCLGIRNRKPHGYNRDCNIYERSFRNMESKTSLIYRSIQGRLNKTGRITKNSSETRNCSPSRNTCMKRNFESLYGNGEVVFSEGVEEVVDRMMINSDVGVRRPFQFSPTKIFLSSPSSGVSSSSGKVNEFDFSYFNRPNGDSQLYRANVTAEDTTSEYFSEFEQNNNNTEQEDFVFDPQIGSEFSRNIGVPSFLLREEEEDSSWEVPNLTNHHQYVEENFSLFNDFQKPKHNNSGLRHFECFPPSPIAVASNSDRIQNSSNFQQSRMRYIPSPSPAFVSNSTYFPLDSFSRRQNQISSADGYKYFNQANRLPAFPATRKYNNQMGNRTPLISFPENDGAFAVKDTFDE